MPITTEDFHSSLYDLLRTKGYQPIPLDSKGKTSPFYPEADIFKFSFVKDGKKYGDVWATVDNGLKLVLYYDDEVSSSPSSNTKGVEVGDSWPALLKHLKRWAQRRQLGFELKNKDHLVSDMQQREYMRKKEQLGEGYYPMGKKASYNDAIPQVKIVIQHSKQLGEGEQRFRYVEKIFVENTEGERFAVPTKKPGLAKIYARHVAEGGTPYDDRGRHLTTLIEEYSKMVGFMRATKNGEFSEAVQPVVEAGRNHFTSLRETLSKLVGHRGYHNYFDSWTPVLNEEQGDENIATLFTKQQLDPRIASCIPILSKIARVDEAKPVKELDNWADEIISETTGLEMPPPKNPKNVTYRDKKAALKHYGAELDKHRTDKEKEAALAHYQNQLKHGDEGVAEGSRDKVHLKTPKYGLADHPGRNTGVGLRTFAQTPEQDRCSKCNTLYKNHYKQGVAEGWHERAERAWNKGKRGEDFIKQFGQSEFDRLTKKSSERAERAWNGVISDEDFIKQFGQSEFDRLTKKYGDGSIPVPDLHGYTPREPTDRKVRLHRGLDGPGAQLKAIIKKVNDQGVAEGWEADANKLGYKIKSSPDGQHAYRHDSDKVSHVGTNNKNISWLYHPDESGKSIKKDYKQGVAEGEVVEFSLPKAIQNLALEWVEYTFLEDGPEQERIENELSKKGFDIDFSDDGNALLLTHSKTGKEFLVQIPEKMQALTEGKMANIALSAILGLSGIAGGLAAGKHSAQTQQTPPGHHQQIQNITPWQKVNNEAWAIVKQKIQNGQLNSSNYNSIISNAVKTAFKNNANIIDDDEIMISGHLDATEASLQSRISGMIAQKHGGNWNGSGAEYSREVDNLSRPASSTTAKPSTSSDMTVHQSKDVEEVWEDELDEGRLSKFLGAAGLAGAMALGGAGTAKAQDYSAYQNQEPAAAVQQSSTIPNTVIQHALKILKAKINNNEINSSNIDQQIYDAGDTALMRDFYDQNYGSEDNNAHISAATQEELHDILKAQVNSILKQGKTSSAQTQGSTVTAANLWQTINSDAYNIFLNKAKSGGILDSQDLSDTIEKSVKEAMAKHSQLVSQDHRKGQNYIMSKRYVQVMLYQLAAKETGESNINGVLDMFRIPSNESLDPKQKQVGQLGPLEKAKNISPVLGKKEKQHPFQGKLVGASESIDPELKRIKTLLKHNKE